MLVVEGAEMQIRHCAHDSKACSADPELKVCSSVVAQPLSCGTETGNKTLLRETLRTILDLSLTGFARSGEEMTLQVLARNGVGSAVAIHILRTAFNIHRIINFLSLRTKSTRSLYTLNTGSALIASLIANCNSRGTASRQQLKLILQKCRQGTWRSSKCVQIRVASKFESLE